MYEGVATKRFVQPDIVVTHFHLREGDRVADFGAGAGQFLRALSRAVGDEGRVYACEIQKNLVESIGKLIEHERISNVDPLWCDLEHNGGIKLADGILDAGMLVNTLFQLEEKALALSEMSRVLRSGAKLFIIDWSESFAGIGPHVDAVVSQGGARTMVEAAGFTYERDFPAGEHHYGLAFRKK